MSIFEEGIVLERAPEEFIVKRTDQAPLRFIGKLIASVETPNNLFNAHVNLKLYKTKGGKYVCYNYESEEAVHRAEVCFTEAKVIDFFGYEEFAQRLYELADIKYMEDIE